MTSPLKIKELWVYPIKSCAGISLNTMEIYLQGPRFDREWMIVDATGNFVTQRQCPQLALIETRIHQDQVEARVPSGQWHTLKDTNTIKKVVVWNSDVEANVCDNSKLKQEISSLIGKSVELVHFGDQSFRARVRTEEGDTPIRFSDSSPLLITNMESLKDLNSRLSKPVKMSRFRPNIVVDGIEAWSEDQLKVLNLADVNLKFLKLCSRCSIVNVDEAAGKMEGKEVLATLAKLRTIEGKVMFGSLMSVTMPGTMSVQA